ncbi:hypothetical protein FA09DRAFT_330257 [Tilletiopsis washingtonensis]|uniref:Uncharacterized protein n=1 Tax=Tilletiopsis washingtonensis TaxID=58919 RepID=A0A316Z7M4_9BASI|nr:hypothetical protein FA09DRAFT_330257 [Tilletiopsis washingtonensis]PWN97571.1 hypothetical protein FA09DRAFT_330257 [Tilletiopsis washingtonensis]
MPGALDSDACPAANRDVVLAARKGLFIVDLENPYDTPRFLAHSSRWEVADCQWNPHPARAHWVASTSNQKLLVWNLDRPESQLHPPAAAQPVHLPSAASLRGMSGATAASMPSLPSYRQPATAAAAPRISRSSAVEHVLHAHGRGITDINWSPFHPDVLASCGIDSWTWAWDMRDPGRPKQGYSAWNAAATQVKWNRASPHRLATSCDNKVLIWDDRKGALPLATIEAHESKIYGIDWSRDTSLGLDRLITCSLDGSVKYWDLASPAAQRAVGHRELVTEPEAVIETPTPVWRARHLPFGSGIMTLPQRGDTSLSMWSKERPDAPVERFVGHRDIVKEYLFRTRGGNNRDNDDREWQLLTWSKDQTLRLWPVSEEATRAVGHKPGGRINVLHTRANARDISFRNPPSDAQAHTRMESADQTPATASSILPPTDATWSLLSGRGSGTRLSGTSPYGSSAMGGAGGNGSPSGPLSSSLGHTAAASFSKHARSFSDLAGAEGNWQLPLSRSAGAQAPGSSLAAPVPATRTLRHSSSYQRPAVGSATMSAGSHVLGQSQRSSLHRMDTNERQREALRRKQGKEPERERDKERRQRRREQGRHRQQQEEHAAAASAGFMTRGAGGQAEQWGMGSARMRPKRGAGFDAVGWISGIRMQPETRRPRRTEREEGNGSSSARGMSGSRATLTGNAEAQLSESEAGATTDHELDAPDAAQTLGEEVMAISKYLSRVTFERIEIAQRTCTCSLYGPWGIERGMPAFLRVTFVYPSAYPAKAPRFELEHNASVPLKTRAFLLRNLSAILGTHARQQVAHAMEEELESLAGTASVSEAATAPLYTGVPSMEACLRFLLGESLAADTVPGTPGVAPPLVNDTEDESEDEEAVLQLRLPPQTCGASFGPNGELVTFSSHHISPRLVGSVPLAALAGSTTGSVLGSVTDASAAGAADGARFLHSYGALSSAMASLARLATHDGADGVGDLDVVQLINSEFLRRRLQRSESKSRSSKGRSRSKMRANMGLLDSGSVQPRRSRSTSPFPRSMPALGSGGMMRPSTSARISPHTRAPPGSNGSAGGCTVRIYDLRQLEPMRPMLLGSPHVPRRRSNLLPGSPTTTPTNERRDPLASVLLMRGASSSSHASNGSRAAAVRPASPRSTTIRAPAPLPRPSSSLQRAAAAELMKPSSDPSA